MERVALRRVQAESAGLGVCCIRFPEGTPVLLVDGSYSPIEDIRPGEWVIGFDETDGVWGSFEVLDQWSAVDDYAMATVWFDDGSSVTATAGHEFFVEGDGWVPLADVESGDPLRSPDGSAGAALVSVEPEALVEVFELDVAIADSFVVSSSSVDVLVHNEDNEFVLDDPSTWSADPVEFIDTFNSRLDASTRDSLTTELITAHGQLPFGDKDRIEDWFDGLDAAELRVAMSLTVEHRDAIEGMLRGSGSRHEWLPVSRAVTAKELGFTAEEIINFSTLTQETKGTRYFYNDDGTPELDVNGNHRNEPWSHAGTNGGFFHRALFSIWDSAPDARVALAQLKDLVEREFRLDEPAVLQKWEQLVADREIAWADTTKYPDRCG